MVREEPKEAEMSTPRGLVVGNYCHDVLIRDGKVIGESLGGAASFISNVLDGLSIPCHYVSKVGSDFAYTVSHFPLFSPSSMTTLFHAHFFSDRDSNEHQDRILKRIHACDPISPSDLPDLQFDFGLAVGVAGEILPETLERMLDICGVVFVDIQALIRVFDPVDGAVKLVGLRDSGFFHLLQRIGFLKASAEEAPFVDVEEARKWCNVVVTDGKDGCMVYGKEGELQIIPFPAIQIDPTGAGDSFLGGFVAGLIQGLAVPDAALVGNFFGSLTVSQIGVPNFNSRLLQRVKNELQGRNMQYTGCLERRDVGAEFRKSKNHEELQAFLLGAAELTTNHSEEDQRDPLKNSTQAIEQSISQQKRLLDHVNEEAIQSLEGQP